MPKKKAPAVETPIAENEYVKELLALLKENQSPAGKELLEAIGHVSECRLPRYLTKPRQRRSEWDMAGSDGISRVSTVFRGKSLLTNKMRII